MSHILIIEDEKDLREALEAVLATQEYTVESCETSEEGLLRVMNKKPHIILLDIMTHSLHGIAFLQKLRELPAEYSDSKVIVLTNLDNEITREQILKFNIDEYRIKAHTSLEEIVQLVKKVLA